jgi:hypothetical protein
VVAHAGFLRDFWTGRHDEFVALVRVFAVAGEALAEEGFEAVQARIRQQLEGLDSLDPGDRELLLYVSRLTLQPRSMCAGHLEGMRSAGLSDRDIFDVNQVACCFSYMNRLADGLGVTLISEDRFDLARELYGDEAIGHHLTWGRREEA